MSSLGCLTVVKVFQNKDNKLLYRVVGPRGVEHNRTAADLIWAWTIGWDLVNATYCNDKIAVDKNVPVGQL